MRALSLIPAAIAWLLTLQIGAWVMNAFHAWGWLP